MTRHGVHRQPHFHTWEEHTRYEFSARDTEATIATMLDDAGGKQFRDVLLRDLHHQISVIVANDRRFRLRRRRIDVYKVKGVSAFYNPSELWIDDGLR